MWDEVDCGSGRADVVSSLVAFERRWQEPSGAVPMSLVPLDALVSHWSPACFPTFNSALLDSPDLSDYVMTFVNASSLVHPCFLPAIFHRMSVSNELRDFRKNRFFLAVYDAEIGPVIDERCLSPVTPSHIKLPSWATGVVEGFLPVNLVFLQRVPSAMAPWTGENESHVPSQSVAEIVAAAPVCRLTFRDQSEELSGGLVIQNFAVFLLVFSASLLLCMLSWAVLRSRPDRKLSFAAVGARARIRREASLSQELTSSMRVQRYNERLGKEPFRIAPICTLLPLQLHVENSVYAK